MTRWSGKYFIITYFLTSFISRPLILTPGRWRGFHNSLFWHPQENSWNYKPVEDGYVIWNSNYEFNMSLLCNYDRNGVLCKILPMLGDIIMFKYCNATHPRGTCIQTISQYIACIWTWKAKTGIRSCLYLGRWGPTKWSPFFITHVYVHFCEWNFWSLSKITQNCVCKRLNDRRFK